MTAIGHAPVPGVVMVRVLHDGVWYPATEVADGAAYELFSDEPYVGASSAEILLNPRPDIPHRYRRFVHVNDVAAVSGRSARSQEAPLYARVSTELSWSALYRMSQAPASEESPIGAVRCTAVVRRGTRMMKVLSARQLGGYLTGWLPSGFCYREYDVAHLRTPTALSALRSDDTPTGDVAFALRWRAVDPIDYEIPFTSAEAYGGLLEMPSQERLGPRVIGSGFAPTDRYLIPEFVTTDLADVPLTANASLVAYTPDGTEVTLYAYLAEQRAWTRTFGKQWRHLLAEVPTGPEGPFPITTAYLPVEPGLSRFIGQYGGGLYEAVADPPAGFWPLVNTRADPHPLDRLARRTAYGSWRGAACTVVRVDGDWLRLRLCRPDDESVARLRARCVERGVYEVWAPTEQVSDCRPVDVEYRL